MARLIDKLKPLEVSKIKIPGYHGDGGGLWLQVSSSGSKSWIFRFTLNRKQREMGLGAVHTVSLAEARLKAREHRLMLQGGKDPLENREELKRADALARAKMMTFDQCANEYIATHRSGWKNIKHAGQWESTLTTYASPIFGAFPVAEIDTSLVMKVLSPIWTLKTETATRVRGRIESVLGWATTSCFREGENPARWKGHLENLLASPNKIKNVQHQPSLSWQEIGAFMIALRQQESIAAQAVEFCILTAARTGEVRGATWDEIDIEGGLWVIPDHRMKGGVKHHVPLSTGAKSLLSKIPKVGKHVFTGANYGKGLSDMSLLEVCRRLDEANIKSGGKGWKDPTLNRTITTHGFRATFRTWGGEFVANSFPNEVLEHALAHKLPDKVEAAYTRGTMFEKRIMLMQAWSDYCDRVQEMASVTPIRKVF
jgi:integrase